jgi:hypothetical protein
MVTFYGYILCLLDIVDALQYGQTMTDGRDAHGLEIVMLQSNQSLADYFILCNDTKS